MPTSKRERSYHEFQQYVQNAFFERWRRQPPIDRLAPDYFGSELNTRPIFMVSCVDRSLGRVIEEIEASEQPIMILRSF